MGGVNFDLTLDYNMTGNYEGWDTFGRVVNQEWTDGQGTPTTLDKYVYTYDRNSNRTARDNQGPSAGTTFDEVYRYDDLDRLLGVERGDLDVNRDITGASRNFTQDWTLDGLGNWADFEEDQGADSTLEVDQTRQVNGANEIDTITGGWKKPYFDAGGNMTRGPIPGDEANEQHYEYDSWHRLTAVYPDDSASPGTPDTANPLASFEYDGRNYRLRKTAGGVIEAYYYNENRQLLETQVSDNMTEEFVWDLRYIDALILRHDGTDTYYYLNDANMNVTALVDAATGNVVERYHYDAYGQVTFYDKDWVELGTQATQYGNDFLYTGRKLDTETGLMYYRARYYDPSLGRFVQRDPIGYSAGDSNLYRYVGNSPTRFIDPYGLEERDYDIRRIEGTEVKEAGGVIKFEDGTKATLKVYKDVVIEGVDKDTGGQLLDPNTLKPIRHAGFIQYELKGDNCDKCHFLQFYRNYMKDEDGERQFSPGRNVGTSTGGIVWVADGQWTLDADPPGEKPDPSGIYVDAQPDPLATRAESELSYFDRPSESTEYPGLITEAGAHFKAYLVCEDKIRWKISWHHACEVKGGKATCQIKDIKGEAADSLDEELQTETWPTGHLVGDDGRTKEDGATSRPNPFFK